MLKFIPYLTDNCFSRLEIEFQVSATNGTNPQVTEDETLASRAQGNFTDPIGVEQHDWKEVDASMSLTGYVTVHTGNGHSDGS